MQKRAKTEQEQLEERETRDDGRRGRDPPRSPRCRWLGKGPQRPFAPSRTALAILFPI